VLCELCVHPSLLVAAIVIAGQARQRDPILNIDNTIEVSRLMRAGQ